MRRWSWRHACARARRVESALRIEVEAVSARALAQQKHLPIDVYIWGVFIRGHVMRAASVSGRDDVRLDATYAWQVCGWCRAGRARKFPVVATGEGGTRGTADLFILYDASLSSSHLLRQAHWQ